MAITYARLINHIIFKNQILFSARFDQQNEDDHLLDETELFINLSIIYNLTELIFIILILNLIYNTKYNNKK